MAGKIQETCHVLYCIVMYFIVLYFIALYFIALYFIVLYCIIFPCMSLVISREECEEGRGEGHEPGSAEGSREVGGRETGAEAADQKTGAAHWAEVGN